VLGSRAEIEKGKCESKGLLKRGGDRRAANPDLDLDLDLVDEVCGHV